MTRRLTGQFLLFVALISPLMISQATAANPGEVLGAKSKASIPGPVTQIHTTEKRTSHNNQRWRYTVEWTAASSGERFQVRLSRPDSRRFGVWKTTRRTRASFANLKSNARYLVQIRAFNKSGKSPLRGTVLRPGVPPGSYVNYGFWILSTTGSIGTQTTITSEGVLQYQGGNSSSNANAPVSMAAAPDGQGYWLLMMNGDIDAYCSAQDFGDCSDCISGGDTFSDIEAAPNGQGLWVLTHNGYVHAVGNVGTWGNCSPCDAGNPGQDLVPGPDSLGYWVLDAAGGIHAMGQAGSVVPNNEWDGVTVPGWGVNDNMAVSVAMNSALTGAIVLTLNGQLLVDGEAPNYGQIGDLDNCSLKPDTASCGRSILFTPDEQGVWVLDGSGTLYTEGDALSISSVPSGARKLVAPATLPADERNTGIGEGNITGR